MVSNILVIMVMGTARWNVKYSPILRPKLQKHEFSGRKMPPKRVIGFLRAAICGFDLRLNPTLLRPLWYLPAPSIASLLDNKNCWSVLLKNISENNHTAIDGKHNSAKLDKRHEPRNAQFLSDQIRSRDLLWLHMLSISFHNNNVKTTEKGDRKQNHSFPLHPEVVLGSRNGSTMQKKNSFYCYLSG